MHTYIHVYRQSYLFICVNIYIGTHTFACICMCVYVHIYIHIHTMNVPVRVNVFMYVCMVWSGMVWCITVRYGVVWYECNVSIHACMHACMLLYACMFLYVFTQAKVLLVRHCSSFCVGGRGLVLPYIYVVCALTYDRWMFRHSFVELATAGAYHMHTT